MADPLKLYALPHSYYSGKTRSYLRYKRIPYREVVSTLRQFYLFIIPRTGVKFIPVIQTPDDVVLQDTTETIDFLETRYPQPPVYPSTPRQKLAALLLELYGDEWLIIQAMHYRWSFWHEEAHINDVLEHFGMLLSPALPKRVRRIAGKRFCKPFNGALPILGITPRTIPMVEAHYEQLLDRLNLHFAQHDYLLGDAACIGDFGFIGALYAHLGRDFHPKALMQKRAPHVYAWVQRMNSTDPRPGNFLPDDQIPETLMPVLRGIFEQQIPVLLDTVKQLDSWLQTHGDRKVPRMIGHHDYVIGGITEQRAVFPYSQWMFQRPLDFYHSLTGPDKADADGLLQQLGGEAAMQTLIARRVRRVNNRLFPETLPTDAGSA